MQPKMLVLQFKEKAAKLGFKAGEDNELKFTHDGARAGASVNSGLLMCRDRPV